MNYQKADNPSYAADTIFIIMTNKEYLRNRQKQQFQKFPVNYTIDKLRLIAEQNPIIKPFWGKASDCERKRFLDNFLSSYVDFLDSHLQNLQKVIIDLCPNNIKSHASEIIVGTLRTFDVNARQLGNQPIIVVHHGLFGFVSDISNIVTMNYLDNLLYNLYEEMSQKMIMTCLCFLSEQPIAVEQRLFQSPESMERLFLNYNESFRNEMELFILAHEFGHIFSTQPSCENAADEWAMNIMLSIPPIYNQLGCYNSHKFAATAGLITLYSYSILERVRANFEIIVKNFELTLLKLHNHTFDNTLHPPSEERIQTYMKMLKNNRSCEDAELFSFIRETEYLFNQVNKYLDNTINS